MSSKPRWYGGMFDPGGGESTEPSGFVQISDRLTSRRTTAFRLPEQVLRLAHAEYDRQFPGQPYERMQERGGLGVLEVVALLADYVERLGGQPSRPGHKHASVGGGRWCNSERCEGWDDVVRQGRSGGNRVTTDNDGSPSESEG